MRKKSIFVAGRDPTVTAINRPEGLIDLEFLRVGWEDGERGEPRHHEFRDARAIDVSWSEGEEMPLYIVVMVIRGGKITTACKDYLH